jgi:hypothetical protein
LRQLRRKWLCLPIGLLLVLAAAMLALFVRGTWADTQRRIPSGIDEGPVCYVHQDESGEKEVCCAIRLAVPMDEVWEAITDYEHFGDICSCVHADRIVHEPDGRCRLEARANSVPPGQLPFAVEMRHEQMLEQYTSSWDQPSGEVQINRGRWVLTPLGPRETLLEVSLEVQVRRVPTFLLRNLSLSRLREVGLAVARRLREGSAGQPW